jgi:hypothetical protein
LKDAILEFTKLGFDEGTSCGAMSSAAELPSQFVAIDVATGSKADLETTPELFNHDESDFGSFDCQGQIDCIFGVAW